MAPIMSLSENDQAPLDANELAAVQRALDMLRNAVKGISGPAAPVAPVPVVAAVSRCYGRMAYLETLLSLVMAPVRNAEMARDRLAFARTEWEMFAQVAEEAATAFYVLDVESASIRVQCAEELQQPRTLDSGDTVKGLSASAAETAASAHPRYLEHKRKTQRAGQERARCERIRDAARMRFDEALEIAAHFRTRGP